MGPLCRFKRRFVLKLIFNWKKKLQVLYLQAYQSICDLLIIFSDKLGRSEIEHIRSLEYKSRMDEHLILDNFVQHYVFSLKQDVAQDETRIEELHKKRNFLACYCKLVVYNIIPTMRAASIFKYYVKVSVGTLENLQNRCSVNQIAQFIFILLVIYHDYLF